MQSEHAAAVRYFTRACKADPSFRRARLERGVLLWRELGRPQEALADFDALLVEDPRYAPALLNRAMVSQNCGDFPAALKDLEAYLALPAPEIQDYRAEVERTAALLRDMIGTAEEE